MMRMNDPSERTDLGSAICPADHPNRIHSLGGGMLVCFECFAKLFGGRLLPLLRKRKKET